MSRSQHIVTAAALGLLFLYFLHGALVSDLFIHVRHGPDLHLHGPKAWLITGWPLAMYALLMLTVGPFQFSSERVQRAAQLALLLFVGVVIVVMGLSIHSA